MREFGCEPLRERRLPFSDLVEKQAAAWRAAIEEGKVTMES